MKKNAATIFDEKIYQKNSIEEDCPNTAPQSPNFSAPTNSDNGCYNSYNPNCSYNCDYENNSDIRTRESISREMENIRCGKIIDYPSYVNSLRKSNYPQEYPQNVNRPINTSVYTNTEKVYDPRDTGIYVGTGTNMEDKTANETDVSVSKVAVKSGLISSLNIGDNKGTKVAIFVVIVIAMALFAVTIYCSFTLKRMDYIIEEQTAKVIVLQETNTNLLSNIEEAQSPENIQEEIEKLLSQELEN